MVPHGEWDRWQRQNLIIKPRTVRDYMQLARLDEEKRRRVANMPLREALKALRHRTSMQSVECYTPARYIEAAHKVLGAIESFRARVFPIRCCGCPLEAHEYSGGNKQ